MRASFLILLSALLCLSPARGEDGSAGGSGAETEAVEVKAGSVPLLIAPAALEQHSDAILVDVRRPETFLKERIRGAVNLPAQELFSPKPFSPRDTAATERALALLGERGLSRDRHLALYADNLSAGDVCQAAYVFWALECLGYERLSLLDGGLARWTAEQRPLASGRLENPLPELELEPVEKARTADISLQHLRQQLDAHVLIDVRTPPQYLGEKPVAGVKRNGHIPGAKNVPYSKLFTTPHIVFKSRDELRNILYQEAGIAPADSIVVYCNTGMTSSALYFVCRLLEHEQVVQYSGGMAEWAAESNTKVMSGPGE